MGDGLKPAFQPLTKHPKSMSVRVGILGASDRPDRYAYLAALELMDQGFDILPINPTKGEILGKPVLKSLLDTDLTLHTLTIYVQPSRLKEHLEAILQKRPKRIVFNPGTEAPELYPILEEAGIEVMEDCTLVMLQTGSFGGSDSSPQR